MTEMVDGAIGVTILGRAGLRYRDGSKTAFIDGEMLTGPADFVVYAESIVAWEGIDQPISNAERDEIIANLKNIFQRNGISVDFD